MRIVPYVDVFLMYLWEVCSTSFYSAILPKSLISFFLLNFFFFVAALGLCCCTWAFSSCGEWGLLFVAVCGLLIAVASLVAEHGL